MRRLIPWDQYYHPLLLNINTVCEKSHIQAYTHARTHARAHAHTHTHTQAHAYTAVSDESNRSLAYKKAYTCFFL